MSKRTERLAAAMCGLLLAGALRAETVPLFDGSDSYVDLGAPDALQIPSNEPFTVEGWMRFNGLSTRDMLYCKNNARVGPPYTYMLGFADGKLAAYNGAWRGNFAVSRQLGRWYHVAFSFGGANMAFYLDGVLLGTAAFSFNNTLAHTVKIGGYIASADINGMVSDVRVWDHARSQAEILNNMSNRLSGAEAGLLGYWPLDEGEGTTVFDGSAAGSHGTLIGASWTTDAGLALLSIQALPASGVTDTSAFLNGMLYGRAADVRVYWDTADHGTNLTWGASALLGEREPGEFSYPLTGLDPNTRYCYTFSASNETSTVWAPASEGFKTIGPPAAVCSGASDVLKNRATLNGALTDGGAAEVWFEWWLSGASETNAAACGQVVEGPVSAVAEGLTPGGAYFYRIAASNLLGTVWSEPVAFSTPLLSAWYISTAGDNTGGGSWATAFTNLQTAIDAAEDGDTIYIRSGAYPIDRSTNTLGQFTWAGKGLTILGGYAGDGGAPGARTHDATILENTSLPTATPMTNRIFFISGVTNGRLARVTLRNGAVGNTLPQATPYQPYYGGGVYAAACSNLVFDTVVFDGNAVYGQRERDGHGGALYAAADTYGTITNCIVRNNFLNTYYSSFNYGAGLYFAGGAWIVRDSVIRDNQTRHNSYAYTVRGMGIYIANGVHQIRNCAITRNLAAVSIPRGDAVHVAGGAVEIANCTLYWHRTEGVRRDGGEVTLRNSIIWECGNPVVGTVTRVTSAVQGVDAAAEPQFERGLFLAASSPYHDAGDRSAAEAGLTGYTVLADGTADSGNAALGYHFPPGTAARDWYVDADGGSDANTGLETASAFKTITRALLTVGPGGRIRAAAGLYDTANGETFPLTLANHYGVQLIGAGPEATILRAPGAENKRVVSLQFVYPDARIEGVTIRDGWIRAQNATGAGLNVLHAQGVVVSCLVTNNLFPDTGSWGKQKGAGIYVADSVMTISNCVVRNNRVVSGYADSSYAAGIHLEHGGVVLNSVVTDNVSIPGAGTSGYNNTCAIGGGLYIGGNATIRNCLIARNEARAGYLPSVGDGVHVAAGTVALENCTIADNLGEGVRCDGGTLTVNSAILWGNGVDATGTLAAAWSTIGNGTYTDDGGNSAADPRFVGAAAGDYRLDVRSVSRSPAINAGDPVAAAWMPHAVDLDGTPRLLNRRVDQGAYENPVSPGGTLLLLR